MLFNSLPFLYAFLPITYAVFWRLRTKEQRYAWLTLTGYVFYGFWSWKFCGLMAFSTVVSYAAGRALLVEKDERRRKLWLAIPVTADLLLLGGFKYTNFVLGTANEVLRVAGVHARAPVLDIVLPIGISFYTFHTISYIVDSYRRVIVPTRSFFEFSCYVSLFSQLVAGPIVRFREIEQDLEHLDTASRTASLARGCSFFALGLAKKVLVADAIAQIVAPALDGGLDLSTAGAWLVMLGYTYQLYFDFSGYSDMAVGLGHLFGIRIPQNFASPYRAVDPADFWRRWHMSLSRCMRDYLYIPFGGNTGNVSRNLLLTMLIGGLWHGANWTFVVWGAYHGLVLVLHRRHRAAFDTLLRPVRQALTFLVAVVGWVFFRSATIGGALRLLRTMFVPTAGALPVAATTLVALVAVAGVIAHAMPNTFELKHAWGRPATLGIALLFAASLVVIYGGPSSPFLYFQF